MFKLNDIVELEGYLYRIVWDPDIQDLSAEPLANQDVTIPLDPIPEMKLLKTVAN